MSRKQSSGIGRGRRAAKASGGGAKMSPEDTYRIKQLEENIRHEDEIIPSYIKESMTPEEMRQALISGIKKNGSVHIDGRTYEKSDVDATYPKPKNSRFDDLVDRLNMIRVSRHEDDLERTIDRHVRRLTAGYSVKELREFREKELGIGLDRWGGREGHIRAISLDLYRRFHDWGSYRDAVFRTRLSAPIDTLTRGVLAIRSAFGRRSTWEDRIDEIRAKYKGGKR